MYEALVLTSTSCFHIYSVESRIRLSSGCVLHYESLDVTLKIFSCSDCLGIWKKRWQRILVNSKKSHLAVTDQIGL